jgi:YHS domain-containing protein
MTRPGGAEMPKLSPPIVQQPTGQPSTDQHAAALPKPQIVDPAEPKAEPLVKPVVEPLVEPVVASVAAKPADQVQVAMSTKDAPVLVAVSPTTAATQESGNLPAAKLPTANLPIAVLPPAELASAEPPADPPKPLPLRANWIGALNPGFRGDTGRATAAYHSTVTRPEPAGPAASSGPVRTGGQLAGYSEQVAPETVNRPKTAEKPPVTLDGFCPVELVTQETWTRGDPRWTAAYQGRTYMFAGQTQRQKFLEHPERFAPAYSGNDAVFAVDGKRQMPGKTDYCVTYQGRLYMFSSSLTLSRFQANPQRYAVSDRP